MPLPPDTTPVPQPVFMPGMSHQGEAPQASPLPVRNNNEQGAGEGGTSTTTTPTTSSSPVSFPDPKLRLRINDLGHAGSTIFLASVTASTALAEGVRTVLRILYGINSSSTSSSSSSSSSPEFTPPPTRSVTLILRDIDGVAYTTGTELDPAHHKEIHLSLRYVSRIDPGADPAHPGTERQASEIRGVLVHELVHCLQHNGRNTCPGGLVEGVADFVRLRAGLAPPHWKRPQRRHHSSTSSPTPTATATPTPTPAPNTNTTADIPSRWDAGYQHTAYFLEYLDSRFGDGEGVLVRRLNAQLRAGTYVEDVFWPRLLGSGRTVDGLWREYCDELVAAGSGEGGDGQGGGDGDGGAKAVGTQTQTQA